ncbi:MAG: YqgE/AlgH family protein [Alphaproteobacteria bacterium]|nr:YqgE/AlgH family protein [Alphaproteobacteria bacterium]
MSVVKSLRAAMNWQMVLAAFFILLPTVLGFYHGDQGKFVLAEPSFDGDNFSRSVLYMYNQTWYDARALVVNKVYPNSSDLPVYLKDRNFVVYWGGPVEDRDAVFVMELIPEKTPVVTTFDGLVKDHPNILRDIEEFPERYRVFVGYAGWGFADFQAEKESGVWLIAPFLSDVFRNNMVGERAWAFILRYSEDKNKPVIGQRQKS